MTGQSADRKTAVLEAPAAGSAALAAKPRRGGGISPMVAAAPGWLGRTKVQLVVLAALIAGLLWSYWLTLGDLVALWRQNADYSAGALAPLVAGYVIWSDRRYLRSLPVRACWAGLALLLAAQAMRLYGLLYMYGSLERFSLLLTAAAGCLLILGLPITWRLGTVLLFLVLMFPLPHRVHNAVSLPLQNFASQSAVVGLEMLGYLVTQEGNVLRLSDQTTVAVAEACSGLRMLTAFVIVAGALAFVVNRPAWQKAIVVASSVPVAILANTLRLIATVILFEHVGSETGEKFFHDFAGYVMIPFAWAVLMVELRLLRWIAGDGAAVSAGTASAGRRRGRGAGSRSEAVQVAAVAGTGTGFRLSAVLATLVILLAAGAGYRALAAKIDAALGQVVPLRQPLATIPLQIGPWQGEDVPLDERIRRIAGDDDFLNRHYVNHQAGRGVGLYIGYMGRPRSRMGHRPDICYPAQGFEQVSEEAVTLATPDHQALPALLYEFRPPQVTGPRQLVLVLYSVNGRYVGSAASANDYGSREVGLLSRRVAYGLRVQLATTASSDRARDVAVLSELASQLIEPLCGILPEAGD